MAVSCRAITERFTSPRAAAGGVAVSGRAIAERFTSPRAAVRRRGGLPQCRCGSVYVTASRRRRRGGLRQGRCGGWGEISRFARNDINFFFQCGASVADARGDINGLRRRERRSPAERLRSGLRHREPPQAAWRSPTAPLRNSIHRREPPSGGVAVSHSAVAEVGGEISRFARNDINFFPSAVQVSLTLGVTLTVYVAASGGLQQGRAGNIHLHGQGSQRAQSHQQTFPAIRFNPLLPAAAPHRHTPSAGQIE